MSESDTMFNGRDRRCAAVQLMLSTDPCYDNRTTLPAPSKCKSGRFNVPRGMKTKFPATVMVFGVVSSEGHIMPPHIFEVSLKVNTKVYLGVPKSVVIPWYNQVVGGRPWMWQQGLGADPQVQRDPGLASEEVLRLCTLLSLSSPPPT